MRREDSEEALPELVSNGNMISPPFNFFLPFIFFHLLIFFFNDAGDAWHRIASQILNPPPCRYIFHN